MEKDDKKQASRRGVLRGGLYGGLVVAAAGVVGLTQTEAQAATKLAQKVAQYQTTPKGTQKCSNCVNYIDPNSCKVVAGTISPDGWCMLYGPKAA